MALVSTYQSKKRSNWLLTVAIFLCAFAGTFEVGYASDFPYTVATTELTISDPVDASVQSIFSDYNDTPLEVANTTLCFCKYPRYSLHIYNQQVRSAFNRLSKPALFCPLRHVLPLKTIPQSSDEDFSSHIG